MSNNNVSGLGVCLIKLGMILGSVLFWSLLATIPLLALAFIFVMFAVGCICVADAPIIEDQPFENFLHV